MEISVLPWETIDPTRNAGQLFTTWLRGVGGLTNKRELIMAIEKPKRKLRIKILSVFIAFATLLSLLGVRLVFLQIVDGQKLQKEAVEQQTRDNDVASKRVTIYYRI